LKRSSKRRRKTLTNNFNSRRNRKSSKESKRKKKKQPQRLLPATSSHQMMKRLRPRLRSAAERSRTLRRSKKRKRASKMLRKTMTSSGTYWVLLWVAERKQLNRLHPTNNNQVKRIRIIRAGLIEIRRKIKVPLLLLSRRMVSPSKRENLNSRNLNTLETRVTSQNLVILNQMNNLNLRQHKAVYKPLWVLPPKVQLAPKTNLKDWRKKRKKLSQLPNPR